MKRRCLAVLLLLLAATATADNSLIADFRNSLQQGMTFYLAFGPNQHMFLTLKGTEATVRFQDSKDVSHSTFTLVDTTLTIHTPGLASDLALVIQPLGTFARLRTTKGFARCQFHLAGKDTPIGGVGPIDADALTASPSP